MKDIHDIKTWPPGAVMLFDNRVELEKLRKEDLSSTDAVPHVGFGLVVANNGSGRIQVLWDENCARRYLMYEVRMLNPKVISRIG